MIDFAVEAGELARAVAFVAGTMPSGKTTMPILNAVLLRTSAGKLSIFSSAVEMESEIEIAADVGQDGVAAVPRAVLAEIAKRLPKTATAMVAPTGSNDGLKLACGRARFNLPTLEAETMPVMPEPDSVIVVHVKASDLKKLIETIAPCAADCTESDWQFAGVNLSVQGEKLYGLGFDRQRGAILEVDVISIGSESGTEVPPRITVPNSGVRQITSMCRGGGIVELRISDRLLDVRNDGVIYRTRLVDAEYTVLSPDQRVKVDKPLFRVKASDLAEVVERVSAVFADVPSGSQLVRAVGIKAGEAAGEIVVVAGGVRGVSEAHDVLAAEELGLFNSELALVNRQFEPALAAFGESMIEFRQVSPGLVVQITSPERPELRYFLAPMSRR